MTRGGLKEENLVTRESKKITGSKEELAYKSTDPPSEIITKRRRKPRMKFTEEELADSRLSKTIKLVNKAED